MSRNRNETPKIIAQKMLEGYTMLADTCRTCDPATVLLRSRDGRVICVTCEGEATQGAGTPGSGGHNIVTTIRDVTREVSERCGGWRLRMLAHVSC
mmetsp:Transcript_43844/g.137749  ORF Transcript_43844/g.137749 Transcript_43844/m.137749 type:complete len:96 (+) Transcript_43844:125-412(+)